ncbi:Transcriptional regulator of nonfermentable carbon utilization [Tieghemiomyces parasiticus]|uniref:Transcriptional regulator of nonfermentable carbon utilization n=1 Tax=Tieghemiomyces parasiticus TaxID=78921 RepID=A0A9W7ZQV8_9FUNG|nr:Transcriptional regulator of nonfermentable carbon utilization [Tieghemiomyces parasiticus]
MVPPADSNHHALPSYPYARPDPPDLGDEESAAHRRARRRKAARACLDCQRAHLTCDDSRPCRRCVKRGLADSCRDGVRKTAKYLLDDPDDGEDDLASSTPPSQGRSEPPASSPPPEGSPLTSFAGAPDPTFAPGLTAYSAPLASPGDNPALLNLANYGFGSESANLEYNMLSRILNNSLLNSRQPQAASAGLPGLGMADVPWQSINGADGLPAPFPAHLLDGTGSLGYPHLSAAPGYTAPCEPGPPPLPPSLPPPAVTQPPPSCRSHGGVLTGNGTFRSSRDVYHLVKEPFRYVDGFHFLMHLIRDRMSKEEAARIMRAMALFRPTFIAMNMNLATEDLVFMEKCFQRTLLEFEKLVSYSGTPTVVWRRTGEIALVGKEFAMLTGWTKEQLLGAAPDQPSARPCHRYIFELMDNASVVDYWERFAQHAYGDSEHAVMTTCQLRRPTGQTVPCTFCFTIRRDIFDIPLAIVGNFLPILS